MSHEQCSGHMRSALRCTVLCALLALSAAPHQEARFLLPLVPPLVLLYCRALRHGLVLTVWLAFNAVLVAAFGCAHQGGVVRALAHLQQAGRDSHPGRILAVFYRTYMPPRSLVVPSTATASGVAIEDVQEALSQAGTQPFTW